MVVIASWTVDSRKIELMHEHARSRVRGKWEYRVDGEVKMYGYGTPQEAREAMHSRRKLSY